MADVADIATLPFEKALAELDQIVRTLEAGSASLDDSLTLFARGEALKAHCDRLLKAAEAKVEKIRLDASGRPTGTEPLDEA